MPVPENTSGTSTISPASSSRPRVSLKSILALAISWILAPSPGPITRASDTTVASLSAMVKSRCETVPADHVAGSVPSAIRSVSVSSSTASSLTLSVAVPLLAPCAMVTFAASV